MIEELETLAPNVGQTITREELMYAAPGFYRIRTKDKVNRRTGEKSYGSVQLLQGQRYESNRVHVAHVILQESCRDFIGYEGLNITSRQDGYKIVDGWCRADRLEIEARTR